MTKENKVVATIKYEGIDYSFGIQISDYEKDPSMLDALLLRVIKHQLDSLLAGLSVEEYSDYLRTKELKRALGEDGS